MAGNADVSDCGPFVGILESPRVAGVNQDLPSLAGLSIYGKDGIVVAEFLEETLGNLPGDLEGLPGPAAVGVDIFFVVIESPPPMAGGRVLESDLKLEHGYVEPVFSTEARGISDVGHGAAVLVASELESFELASVSPVVASY